MLARFRQSPPGSLRARETVDGNEPGCTSTGGGNRSLKALSALGFSLLTCAIVLILFCGPATGYEISIYETLPGWVWMCMFASVAIGFGIGVQQALSPDAERNTWWAVGLAIVLANNLVFLLLPVLRGYVLYGREDAMTHVGYAVDIVTMGVLPASDVYPIQHILVAALSRVTGLSPMITTGCLTPLLSILYVGFIFCLARSVLRDPRSVRLATLSSTVLLFSPTQYHASLVPAGVGVLLMPLAVYGFLKSILTPSVEYSVVAILVVGIMLPFVHPLIWVIVSGALVLLGLVRGCLRRKQTIPPALRKAHFVVLEISVVVFSTWFLRFYLAEHLIKLAYARFFGPGLDFTMMDRVLQSADKVGYRWWDVVILAAKIGSHDFVYVALCVIAVIGALGKIRRGQASVVEHNILTLTPVILCPSLFFIMHLFATVAEFGILRFLTTISACAPVFVAYVLSGLCRPPSTHLEHIAVAATKLTRIFVALILLSCWFAGFVSAFGWLFIKQPNQQVTHMEAAGVKWLAEHKADTVSADLNRMMSRFTDGLFGTEWRTKRGIYRVAGTTSPIGALPRHLGYSSRQQLGEWFDEDVYVPLSTYDRTFHAVFFPEFDQFEANDFEALHRDTSADRVFSDGEFEVWYIRSAQSKD
jgi:hypothetical protein